MNVSVNVTPRVLNLGQPNHAIVQNIGNQPVFLARGSSNVAARGLRINAGDAIELVEPLSDGGNDYFVATASGTSSVRLLLWN